ncbi:MAG: hypothetical protein V4612_05490 [Pseudomonadota bacterium]
MYTVNEAKNEIPEIPNEYSSQDLADSLNALLENKNDSDVISAINGHTNAQEYLTTLELVSSRLSDAIQAAKDKRVKNTLYHATAQVLGIIHYVTENADRDDVMAAYEQKVKQGEVGVDEIQALTNLARKAEGSVKKLPDNATAVQLFDSLESLLANRDNINVLKAINGSDAEQHLAVLEELSFDLDIAIVEAMRQRAGMFRTHLMRHLKSFSISTHRKDPTDILNACVNLIRNHPQLSQHLKDLADLILDYGAKIGQTIYIQHADENVAALQNLLTVNYLEFEKIFLAIEDSELSVQHFLTIQTIANELPLEIENARINRVRQEEITKCLAEIRGAIGDQSQEDIKQILDLIPDLRNIFIDIDRDEYAKIAFEAAHDCEGQELLRKLMSDLNPDDVAEAFQFLINHLHDDSDVIQAINFGAFPDYSLEMLKSFAERINKIVDDRVASFNGALHRGLESIDSIVNIDPNQLAEAFRTHGDIFNSINFIAQILRLPAINALTGTDFVADAKALQDGAQALRVEASKIDAAGIRDIVIKNITDVDNFELRIIDLGLQRQYVVENNARIEALIPHLKNLQNLIIHGAQFDDNDPALDPLCSVNFYNAVSAGIRNAGGVGGDILEPTPTINRPNTVHMAALLKMFQDDLVADLTEEHLRVIAVHIADPAMANNIKNFVDHLARGFDFDGEITRQSQLLANSQVTPEQFLKTICRAMVLANMGAEAISVLIDNSFDQLGVRGREVIQNQFKDVTEAQINAIQPLRPTFTIDQLNQAKAIVLEKFVTISLNRVLASDESAQDESLARGLALSVSNLLACSDLNKVKNVIQRGIVRFTDVDAAKVLLQAATALEIVATTGSAQERAGANLVKEMLQERAEAIFSPILENLLRNLLSRQPAINAALNFIQNYALVLDGFEAELPGRINRILQGSLDENINALTIFKDALDRTSNAGYVSKSFFQRLGVGKDTERELAPQLQSAKSSALRIVQAHLNICQIIKDIGNKEITDTQINILAEAQKLLGNAFDNRVRAILERDEALAAKVWGNMRSKVVLGSPNYSVMRIVADVANQKQIVSDLKNDLKNALTLLVQADSEPKQKSAAENVVGVVKRLGDKNVEDAVIQDLIIQGLNPLSSKDDFWSKFRAVFLSVRGLGSPAYYRNAQRFVVELLEQVGNNLEQFRNQFDHFTRALNSAELATFLAPISQIKTTCSEELMFAALQDDLRLLTKDQLTQINLLIENLPAIATDEDKQNSLLLKKWLRQFEVEKLFENIHKLNQDNLAEFLVAVVESLKTQSVQTKDSDLAESLKGALQDLSIENAQAILELLGNTRFIADFISQKMPPDEKNRELANRAIGIVQMAVINQIKKSESEFADSEIEAAIDKVARFAKSKNQDEVSKALQELDSLLHTYHVSVSQKLINQKLITAIGQNIDLCGLFVRSELVKYPKITDGLVYALFARGDLIATFIEKVSHDAERLLKEFCDRKPTSQELITELTDLEKIFSLIAQKDRSLSKKDLDSYLVSIVQGVVNKCSEEEKDFIVKNFPKKDDISQLIIKLADGIEMKRPARRVGEGAESDHESDDGEQSDESDEEGSDPKDVERAKIKADLKADLEATKAKLGEVNDKIKKREQSAKAAGRGVSGLGAKADQPKAVQEEDEDEDENLGATTPAASTAATGRSVQGQAATVDPQLEELKKQRDELTKQIAGLTKRLAELEKNTSSHVSRKNPAVDAESELGAIDDDLQAAKGGKGAKAGAGKAPDKAAASVSFHTHQLQLDELEEDPIEHLVEAPYVLGAGSRKPKGVVLRKSEKIDKNITVDSCVGNEKGEAVSMADFDDLMGGVTAGYNTGPTVMKTVVPGRIKLTNFDVAFAHGNLTNVPKDKKTGSASVYRQMPALMDVGDLGSYDKKYVVEAAVQVEDGDYPPVHFKAGDITLRLLEVQITGQGVQYKPVAVMNGDDNTQWYATSGENMRQELERLKSYRFNIAARQYHQEQDGSLKMVDNSERRLLVEKNQVQYGAIGSSIEGKRKYKLAKTGNVIERHFNPLNMKTGKPILKFKAESNQDLASQITQFGQQGFGSLKFSTHHNYVDIDLRGSDITNLGELLVLQTLLAKQNLKIRKLDVSNCKQLTDISALKNLEIKDFKFHGCKNIEDFKPLVEMHNNKKIGETNFDCDDTQRAKVKEVIKAAPYVRDGLITKMTLFDVALPMIKKTQKSSNPNALEYLKREILNAKALYGQKKSSEEYKESLNFSGYHKDGTKQQNHKDLRALTPDDIIKLRSFAIENGVNQRDLNFAVRQTKEFRQDSSVVRILFSLTLENFSEWVGEAKTKKPSKFGRAILHNVAEKDIWLTPERMREFRESFRDASDEEGRWKVIEDFRAEVLGENKLGISAKYLHPVIIYDVDQIGNLNKKTDFLCLSKVEIDEDVLDQISSSLRHLKGVSFDGCDCDMQELRNFAAQMKKHNIAVYHNGTEIPSPQIAVKSANRVAGQGKLRTSG